MSGYHQCDGTETTATCGDGDLPERHCTFPSTGAEDITLDRLFQCSEHGSAAHGSDANTSARPRNTALYAAFSPKAEYTAEGSHVYRVIAGLGGPGTEHTMVSSSDARDEAGGASARL